MGFFGRSGPDPQFDTWQEPRVDPASPDWVRRLDAFAKKSARTLRDNKVPLFRSAWPRSGVGTFRDAFWMIAVDVEFASRFYVNFQPNPRHKTGPGNPPPPSTGTYSGHLRGGALLLTGAGILCGADCEGFMVGFGGVDSTEMDMLFTNVRRDTSTLGGQDGWGWYNRGRWRPDPRADICLNGVNVHTESTRFQERFYRAEALRDLGYGTSAALSACVRNSGSTRWPKEFTSFHY